MVLGEQNAAEEGFLVRALVIHSTDVLILIAYAPCSVGDEPARVGCLRKLVGDQHRGLTEQRWIDAVVHKWRSQRDRAARIARSRSESCEVSRQHRRRRNERFV